MNIPDRITTALKDSVDLYYLEASTDKLPYVVYDYDSSPFRTKDGVYKYVANVRIAIVADTLTEAESIDTTVHSLISTISGLKIQEGIKRPMVADNNVQVITREYTITQYV